MSFPTSRIDEFAGEDLLVLLQNKSQDYRSGTLNLLVDFMQANLTFESAFASQYSSPLTGATVQVTDGSSNVHLMLSPAGTLAALTISLPAVANLVDKQEVLVTSTQALTSLTISANGASNVFGAPTTLSAGGFFRFKYDSNQSNWNRVG